jgi:hypothetical protein
MTLSAEFSVGGVSSVVAHEVNYGDTVNLALVSDTGVNVVSWTIQGTSHESFAAPTITPAGSPSGKTASFVMPADPGGGEGRSVLVKCTVTDSALNQAVAYRVVGVPNEVGTVPIAAGEENHRSTTHGWLEPVNAALAGVAGGAASIVVIVSGLTEDEDAQPQIQAAVDANPDGATIVVPPGSYTLAQPIRLYARHRLILDDVTLTPTFYGGTPIIVCYENATWIQAAPISYGDFSLTLSQDLTTKIWWDFSKLGVYPRLWSEFNFEMWVRFTDALNGAVQPEAFFGINGALRGNSTGGTTVMRHTDDKLRWQIWIGDTEYNLYSDNPTSLDTDYHMCTGSYPGREMLLVPPHMRIGGFRFGPRSWRDSDSSFTAPTSSYTLTQLEVIWNPLDANVFQTSSNEALTLDMYRFDLYEHDGYLQHHRETTPSAVGHCAIIGGTIVGGAGNVVGIGTIDLIGETRCVIDGLVATNVSHGPWLWNNSFFPRMSNVRLVGGSSGDPASGHRCRDAYTFAGACGLGTITNCEAYGFNVGFANQNSGMTITNLLLNDCHKRGALLSSVGGTVATGLAITSEESTGVPDYFLHIINPVGAIDLDIQFNTIDEDTIPVAVYGENSSYDATLIKLRGAINQNDPSTEYISYLNPSDGKTLVDITDLTISPVSAPISLTPERLIQSTGKNRFAQPVYSEKVTTTDDTETTVLTIPLPDESVSSFGVRFVGEDQTTGEIFMREMTFVIKRQGGGSATQVGLDSLMFDEVPTDWDAFHDESGSSVLLKVVGDAANDVKWTVIAYQTITPLY